MLLIWLWGSVVDGAAGKAVRSAKDRIPCRPTFVSQGVGDGLGPPPAAAVPVAYPARFISSKPPSSYTANAYLQITAFGEGAGVGPSAVTSTQSGATKVGVGEALMLVSLGFPLGIK